jgi:ABC-2 type transport system permease protein
MKPRGRQVKETLRITGAIARKDIVDAVKSKTTALIVAATFMLILSSKALPLLLDLRGVQQVVAYDAGEAEFLAQPGEDDDVVLYRVTSQAELEDTISESRGKTIGIAIPADFDEKISQNGTAEVEGYVAHWINLDDQVEMRTIVEAKLTHAVGKPVSIHTEGNELYPRPDSGGQPFMVALVLLVAVILITVMVVPQLLIEEKETRTLDALFLSPASVNEVVAGKALAGLVFALLGAGVVLVFNAAMIQNWALTLAALLCGALFAVAVGLLLGIVVEDQQSLNLVLGFVFVFLIFPAFLVNVMGPDWPELVRIILPWIPTVALSNVLRISFSDTLETGEIIGGLTIVLASAAALYALATWRMSQLERE